MGYGPCREEIGDALAEQKKPQTEGERIVQKFHRPLTATEANALIAAINSAIDAAVAGERERLIKEIDYCTCGSGPEWRSVNMRYHQAGCQVFVATMIRALEAAKESKDGK
jgi:hypothetical protein